MVVAQTPGGGIDTWGRLVARHLGKYLPGNPNIIAENVAGGTTRVGTNRIYAAKPDGLTIGIVDRTIPTNQLRGEGPDDGVRYDVTKMAWLGSTTTENQVFMIHKRSGVTTVKDMPTKEVKWGEMGVGSGPQAARVVLTDLLAWKVKTAFGFQGSKEVLLSIQRGEVDGIVVAWDSIMQQQADDVKNGTMIPLVQFGGGKVKDPLAASVPLAADLLKDKGAEAQQLLALVERPYVWSRPFVTGPDLDPKVVATMRAAFMATMADKEFLAEAQKLKLEVDAVSGERVQELIAEYLKTPKAVVAKLDALMKADTPK